MSFKYWDAAELLAEKPDARYYFILSARATGKTYSVVRQSTKDNYDNLGMFAYIRRHDEDIKTKNLQELFGAQDIADFSTMKNGKPTKIQRNMNVLNAIRSLAE